MFVILKTTKTIELDETGIEMKEVKTQSFIPVDKQPTAYLERDRQLREATRVRTKPRPASEMVCFFHVFSIWRLLASKTICYGKN